MIDDTEPRAAEGDTDEDADDKIRRISRMQFPRSSPLEDRTARNDYENFVAMLNNQMLPDENVPTAERWREEIYEERLRRGEIVVNLEITKVGFVFDSETGRLKYSYSFALDN